MDKLTRKGFFRKSGQDIAGSVVGFVKGYKPSFFEQRPVVETDHPPLFPPGHRDQTHFLTHCTGCGECVALCPHNSIELKIVEGQKVATINPYNIPCMLCKEVACTHGCPTEALTPITDRFEIKIGFAAASFRCLNQQKGEKVCDLCQQYCPFQEACITFNPFHMPVINRTLCTGCGICAAICPERGEGILIFPV